MYRPRNKIFVVVEYILLFISEKKVDPIKSFMSFQEQSCSSTKSSLNVYHIFMSFNTCYC